MNINLHIDSIVLDGIDMAHGQSHLLQHSISTQLTTMLRQRFGTSDMPCTGDHATVQGASVQLTQNTTAASLGPQLAGVVYASIPRPDCGSHTAHGGQQ